MEKYTYMVNPRIPLKICNMEIRRSKNLELTKDEVKFALKHGPVYRKFDARTLERVTLQNIDSLHVEVKGVVKTSVVENINVEDAIAPLQTTEEISAPEVVDLTKGEEITPDILLPEDKTEETVETTETEEKTVDEEVNNDEVKDDTTEDVETVETTEEVEEEKVEVKQERQFTNNNYYRKKKRNR